jgi:hypothetical protein
VGEDTVRDIQACTQWDADAVAKFRDEHRNKAGER